MEVSQKVAIFAPQKKKKGMIKVYESKEEKLMAFKKSIDLHKVWEDLTSGKMSFEEFKRQGYRTVDISL